MSTIEREFLVFAKRIMRHKKSIEAKTDELVKAVFINIAQKVVTHNPVWSGQSVLNWTAAVAMTSPRARFVNVPRSNTRVAKRTMTKKLGSGVTRRRKLRKVTGARQGSFKNIQRDPQVAMTSRVIALGAIRAVAASFRNPSKPSSSLPSQGPVQRLSTIKPPSFFLSNNIDYAPKLWSGSWKSNPRTLAGEVASAKRIIDNARLLGR